MNARGGESSASLPPDEDEPQQPFTTGALYSILCDKVIKAGPKPRADDPAIKELANSLSFTKLWFTFASKKVREDKEIREKISAAIDVLAELLPALMNYEESKATLAEFRDAAKKPPLASLALPFEELIQGNLDDIQTLESLNSAILKARMRGLPHKSAIRGGALGKPPEKWMDLAKGLVESFAEAFPKQSKLGGFRLVKEVVPYITGENPSFEAVRSHFMHKRS